MIERAAFLEAIRSAPDDDGPRLVFADWLEEQGETERAEFVRGQIELERKPKRGSARGELAERVDQLKKKHFEAWFKPLSALCLGEMPIRRGFVESMEMVAQKFLDHAPVVFAAEPVGVFKFHDASATIVRELVKFDPLVMVRKLTIYRCEIRHATMRLMAESPRVASLRWLNLGENRIGPSGAAALAESEHFANLEFLDVRHNSLGSDGASALAGSSRLKKLRHLDLCGDRVTAEDAVRLIRSESLPALTDLGVWYNRLGDEGAAAIAAEPKLLRLTHLNLNNNRIGPDGARALADSAFAANLRELYLAYNRIGDAGALALMESPHLSKLTVLNLYRNENIAPETRERLRERFRAGVSFEPPP